MAPAQIHVEPALEGYGAFRLVKEAGRDAQSADPVTRI
jgi:hypothetical protein